MKNHELDRRNDVDPGLLGLQDFHAGDRVIVEGEARNLWIEDYDCSVCTYGTVEEDVVGGFQKKVLVLLEEIDDETKVCARVRRSKLKKERF